MSWLRRLWYTIRPSRLQRDIDRELSFHLAERADHLRSQGLCEEEAARRARLQFGNPAVQAERTLDVDLELWLDALLRNIRYAARTLARAPGFTASVVLTLALGIGANSAVFSAIDAVLLRPLPFPDSDRLVRVGQVQDRTSEQNIAPIRLEEWNRMNGTFDGITGYFTEDISDTSGDLPERVRRAFVAERFVDVWGVPPRLGRGFTEAEHRHGGPAAVLISDRYWRRRFNGDTDVIGRHLRFGTATVPVVGLMPASFLFPDRDVDVWFPSATDAPYAQFRFATWYTGVGRLKPGVTLEQAHSDLMRVQSRLGEQFPDTDRNLGVHVVALKELTVGGIRASLWLLFGAVTLLLLITCTNIAALLLSRAAHRQQEIRTRLRLGASRGSIAWQMLTETTLLALAGASAGLVLAVAAASWFRSAARELPRVDEIMLNWDLLLYTGAISLAAALLCGGLPALRIARRDGHGSSGEASRTQVSTRSSVQWLLVGAQVALSVTLLAGAALLVRSFHELSRVNPGFEPRRVLTFHISGTWAETNDLGRLAQRIDGTIEALRAIPGVAAAATTGWSLPGVPAQWETSFRLVEGRLGPDQRLVAEARAVSPEYFETMRIPIVAGENCRRQAATDQHGAPRGPEAMVNQTFVARYLAGTPVSVVGLHLAELDKQSPRYRVVGVAGDARERGLDREPGPTVYWCLSAPNPTPYFLVRTHTEPLAIAQAVRLKVKELEPFRAVYDIAPLEDRIGEAFTENRLRTMLLVLFAGTALALACVGVYGTLSYVVSLSRREVGLRLALGAGRSDIVRQFLMQGLRVLGPASVAGLILSFAFSRVLTGMLYGVSPSDPLTLAGVLAVVLSIGAVAALVPATRAAWLEPMQVLRDE